MEEAKPAVVDLFSGVGGLSLGAARAGFDVCGAVDIDPQAMAAHARNFTETKHFSTDVSGLTGESLRSSLDLGDRELSGIIGGPPCQGFSSIGHRDRADLRNDLFVEFFRVVAEARPKFFLAENVPGLMSDGYSFVRERALAQVAEVYETLPPLRIAANDYGAPTSRTRMFFFGYLPDEMDQVGEDDFLSPADGEVVHVRQALDGLPSRVDPLWQSESQGWRISRCHGQGYYSARLHGHIPAGVGDAVALNRLKKESRSSGTLGTVHSSEVAKRYAALKPGEFDRVSKARRLDPNGFCPTLRAGTGPDLGSYQAVRPIHPTVPRVITPREAARLQGFPDWFTFSPSKWHSFRQIGSSVSPIVAEQLMSVVRKKLSNA